jgi:hypothetical protein
MDEGRAGERFAWIGGWLGGFIWVALLSGIFAVQGRFAAAGAGLLLVTAAVAAIVLSAPWRHPDTPYWKLMLPVYALLFASLAWLVVLWDGSPEQAGLDVWQLPLLLLLVIPFKTVGRRTWRQPGP